MLDSILQCSYPEQRCSGMQAAAPKKAAAPKAKKAITKKVCSTERSGSCMYALLAGSTFICNMLAWLSSCMRLVRNVVAL